MITYTGESFFFPHSGRRGVILLHAYTGNTNDVRMLGLSVGIIAGLFVVALLFKKKVLDMHFDERQELARGTAFQYGLDRKSTRLNSSHWS